MSDDPLDRAISAYRGAGTRPAPDATATRTRVLRSVVARERRRTMRRWSALAVLLLASNATTWAWSSGRLERVAEAWSVARVAPIVDAPTATPEVVAPTAPPEVVAPTAPPEVVAPTAPPEVVAPTAPPEVVTPTVAVPVADRSPPPSARVRAASRSPQTRTAAERPTTTRATDPDAPGPAAVDAHAPIDSADREAFERAHRAHFDGADTVAALAAWDAYLAGFPEGRFLPEAMFNRAICLLRLGRAEEARPALERIAAGDLGPAHRDDARALLLRPDFQ